MFQYIKSKNETRPIVSFFFNIFIVNDVDLILNIK